MDINKCKTYAEIGRLLGFSYYNGSVKKAIVKYCEDNGLNVEEIIANNNKPNICLFCGKEIEGKRRFVKKFCNSSCAAKYNNKGRGVSEEQKNKISLTLHTKYVNGEIGKYAKNKDICEYRKMSELILDGLILNPYNVIFNDLYVEVDKCKERICKWCGKSFKPYLRKGGKISKSEYCSKECRNKGMKNSLSKRMQQRVASGIHQGWKSRNIISYPEKFWAEVLDNNHIVYEREKYVFNKYFLDFYIEKNDLHIDLEIDGKQHLYEERQKHDEERDKFLTEHGFIVYRIPWNEINSEIGKNMMKNKIDNFLLYFNTIQND